MPVAVAIAGVAVSAIAAKKQSDAAKDASRAGQQSAQQGMDYQRERDDIFDGNIAPYLGAGTESLAQLGKLNSGDYSGFENSPDFLYARGQMQQGVERGAAARGGLYSGGTNVDLANAMNGIASQNLGNYRSSLMGMANLGQNSAVGAGNMGQQSANAMSRMFNQQGEARGQGAINSANAFSNGLQGAMGAFGSYMGSRQSSYQPQSYGGFTPNQGGSLGPSNGKTWNFGGGG